VIPGVFSFPRTAKRERERDLKRNEGEADKSEQMHYARFPEGDQIRHVQYICMTPRKFADDEALEAKKWCFENNVGTTHWPHW
jgi:hypothetical protein